jgi:fucose permease
MPYALLYALIFTAGMAFSTTGSIVPEISETFALAKTQVSSLPLSQFAGGFVGLGLLAFLVARNRAKPGTLLTAAIFTMSASALSLAALTDYSPAVLVAFFCAGASMSLIFDLTGALIARSSGEASARNLNIHYSFMSAGVVLSPLLHGALVFLGARYTALFLSIGVLSAALGVVTLFTSVPRIDLADGFSLPAVGRLPGEYRVFMIVVLAMSFCYMGAEAIPNNWIPKYLDDTFPAAGGVTAGGVSGFRSRLVLALFWAAVTAGRRACAALLAAWKKPLALLGLLSLAVALFLIAVPTVKGRGAAESLLAASGLFYSGMIPIIFSLTEHVSKSTSSVMLILALAVGMLGASLTNKAVGLVADAVSFRAAVSMGALPLLVIIALIPVVKRVPSGSGGEGPRGGL